MEQKKLVGLMDCNNFFVSCERLFRPDLAKKPVLVLSSNDGCVVSRSQEVKDLGISMGTPYFMVKNQCEKHGVTVFSSNFTLYRDISARVMTVLRQYFEVVEQYSIDEAFFMVDSNVPETEIAAVRQDILQKTGIPVSFGIGKTKTIAKLASAEAKKREGVMYFSGEYRNAYTGIFIGSVWGVGPQTAVRLAKESIKTIGDFITCDYQWVRKKFGLPGESLYRELLGEQVDQVTSGSSRSESSLMSTRSFKTVIRDPKLIQDALRYHTLHLAEKLRKKRLCTTEVRIVMAPGKRSDFILWKATASVSLGVPTNDTVTLLKLVRKLQRDLYRQEVPYKRAGVIVSGLRDEQGLTKSFFQDLAVEKRGEIDRVVDSLNQKFGRQIIGQGLAYGGHGWGAAHAFRSPLLTTQWNEIAIVKAT